MDKIIELMLWPPYLYMRALHFVVVQSMLTVDYIKTGREPYILKDSSRDLQAT